MLGGSSSSTATATSHTTGNMSTLPNTPSEKKFPCNTCDLVFENSQAQRTHMREPWHVYNLKLRMESLPPISADTYAEYVATSLVSSKKKSSHATSSSMAARSSFEDEKVDESDKSEDVADKQVPTNRCLFCTEDSDDPEANLEHMSSEHDFHIPMIDQLSSLETTIEYLRTVINEYQECLYCGITKQSAQGIRRHMLNKDHCKINLEREPELLEFWELSDLDGSDTDDEMVSNTEAKDTDISASKDLSQGEYTLPSGRIIGSKSKARETRIHTRRTALAAKKTDKQMVARTAVDHNATTSPSTTTTEPLLDTQGRKQNTTIAVRDAAGLVGVSNQQLRSLTTLHRKMQRQQAIVRASAKWADELGGTHQKHYKQKMNLRDG